MHVTQALHSAMLQLYRLNRDIGGLGRTILRPE